jgi:hypothetical protein
MPPVCSVSEDDIEIGRTAPTAPRRSRWVTSPVLAQRGGDGGLAAHGDEVGGDEAGRAFGDRAQVDVLGQRHARQQAAQQLDPGAQVGEGEAQLAVDELGGAQAGVDGFGRGRGGDKREAGCGDGVAQRVEHEGGQRRRGRGGQERLDVGDDEQGARSRAAWSRAPMMASWTRWEAAPGSSAAAPGQPARRSPHPPQPPRCGRA